MSLHESKLAKTDRSVRSSDSGSSQEDFLVSDKDLVLPSDSSHLGSIRVYSNVSDIFAEATNKDPGGKDQEEASTEDANFIHENQDSSLEIPGVAQPNNIDDIDEEEVPPSIPGGRSIAHNKLNNQHCPFLSNDIKTGVILLELSSCQPRSRT
jgi:hypothetical protein